MNYDPKNNRPGQDRQDPKQRPDNKEQGGRPGQQQPGQGGNQQTDKNKKW